MVAASLIHASDGWKGIYTHLYVSTYTYVPTRVHPPWPRGPPRGVCPPWVDNPVLVVWRCRRLTSCLSPLGGRFRIAGAPALAILWPRFPVPAVLVAWRCRCRIAGAPAFAMLWLWFSVPAVLAVWRCSCGIAGAPALPILWPSFGACNLGCLEMLLSRRHSGTPGLPRTGKGLLTVYAPGVPSESSLEVSRPDSTSSLSAFVAEWEAPCLGSRTGS